VRKAAGKKAFDSGSAKRWATTKLRIGTSCCSCPTLPRTPVRLRNSILHIARGGATRREDNPTSPSTHADEPLRVSFRHGPMLLLGDMLWYRIATWDLAARNPSRAIRPPGTGVRMGPAARDNGREG